MKKLTEKIKNLAKKAGADFVGIAPIERFKNAPLRMSPQGILPDAKSIIVCGIHHLDAAVELSGEPTPHQTGAYSIQSSYMNPKLDDISFLLARFLENKGYRTVPIVSSNIWRYTGYKDLKVHFAPDIAHRYAAVAAGLGEIGWNGLFLHPEFGPRVRLVSIITEANLVPDPMYTGEKLCDKCMQCVKNCPVDAFRKEVKKINEIEIGGRIYRFPDINKWRCGWAENFGLNLALKIPEKVNEQVIMQYLEKYGLFAGEFGSCLRFCMIPQKRYYDKIHTHAPGRKKRTSRINIRDLNEILKRYGIDYLIVENRNNFTKDALIHPEYYLPDAQSIILFGVKKIETVSREFDDLMKWRIIEYASFEIAHYFDLKGYSSITQTGIDSNLVAHKLGAWEKNVSYQTVLTSAKLPRFTFVRKTQKEKIEEEQFRNFCLRQGADLVGFFDCTRFEKFKQIFLENFKMPQCKETVYDISGPYGKFSPIIKEEHFSLKGPETHLDNAKSVIVIGLHYPDACLDRAKMPPAESVGPYAFAQFETLNLLFDIAYTVMKKLNDCGYRANCSYDLTGLASYVISSRGLLPDARANAFAGLLAGLATIGKNGVAISREFGQRQRFISIITDFPFKNDPIYKKGDFCGQCNACIEHCPAKAIPKKFRQIEIEGTTFTIPDIDYFACDWAKRYALMGEEGPKYMGVDHTYQVPEKKRIEKLCKTLTETTWGVQKRHLNICEECIRVCPLKGKRRSKC